MFNKHFFEFERRSRLFEKGDLKYVILDLLKDKPRHGYEIIRALEERFHGLYSPSAGSIYPTLQLLEDMGYVKSLEQDGKKVYTVTEDGRKFLLEREETIDKIRDHIRDWIGEDAGKEFRDTMHDLRDLIHLVSRRAHRVNAEKMLKIREVISRAFHDIETILDQ
jgi:DNA-binding PadR family transcriptional regulator